MGGAEADPGSSPTDPAPAQSATTEAKGAGAPAYVKRGPRALEPGAVGIGDVVADASFVDLDGQGGSLRALCAEAPATVVLFTGLGCPVTKAYAPRLEALTKPWRAEGLNVLVVSPAVLDEPGALRAWGDRQGWTFRLARDEGFALTDALGGRRTADAFLLDREGCLRYRGPIDDQYGINLRLPAPRVRYLEQALRALLAGEPIEEPAFEAPGCRISRVSLEGE